MFTPPKLLCVSGIKYFRRQDPISPSIKNFYISNNLLLCKETTKAHRDDGCEEFFTNNS